MTLHVSYPIPAPSPKDSEPDLLTDPLSCCHCILPKSETLLRDQLAILSLQLQYSLISYLTLVQFLETQNPLDQSLSSMGLCSGSKLSPSFVSIPSGRLIMGRVGGLGLGNG